MGDDAHRLKQLGDLGFGRGVGAGSSGHTLARYCENVVMATKQVSGKGHAKTDLHQNQDARQRHGRYPAC